MSEQFDFSETEDVKTGGGLLPEGEYLFCAEEASFGTHNNKPVINVKFVVQEGEYEGRILFDDIYLKTNSGNTDLRRIKSLLYANGSVAKDFKGSPTGDEMAEMVLGREVSIVVEHSEWNDKTRAKARFYNRPKAPTTPF